MDPALRRPSARWRRCANWRFGWRQCLQPGRLRCRRCFFCQEVDTSTQLGALIRLLRFENRGGPVSRWRRKRRLTKILEQAGIAPFGPLPPACALSAFDLQRAKDITAVAIAPAMAGDSAVVARAEALPMSLACIFGEKDLIDRPG